VFTASRLFPVSSVQVFTFDRGRLKNVTEVEEGDGSGARAVSVSVFDRRAAHVLAEAIVHERRCATPVALTLVVFEPEWELGMK